MGQKAAMAGLTGACLCGATRYVAAGPGKFAITCYCRDCQRVTGTGHAPQLALDRAGFAVEGPLKIYHATSDSGFALEFGFCGDCGSPLTKTTARAESLIFVYAGSLDDPTLFTDPKPVFEAGRQPWD